MLKVGITGGIGSGKTTVCRLFEERGIPIYYADDRGKYLLQHEHFLIDRVKEEFGSDVYEGGTLNKKKLADIVFNDKAKLALLNSLVHPAVYRDTERWIEEQKLKKVPYVIKEAALLIETGSNKNLDKLIVVTAPLNVRTERIKTRDSVSIEEITARMQNQLPEKDKIAAADFVITNNGSIDALGKQVEKIHQQLLKASPLG